ncbi:unnamed protein product, partial [Meganyctiphanes norvegica]
DAVVNTIVGTMSLLLAVLLLLVRASHGNLLASSEASLLGSMMHSAFLFDHMHDDYVRDSILTHPYLSRLPRSIENNATKMNGIFNNTVSSDKRRTLAYDKDSNTFGIDVCLEKEKLYNLPYLDLEFNFKIPVTQVFEDTFFNIEIPHSINLDLFAVTDTPCGQAQWNSRIEPVLTQVEELVSMLGVDGRGCIMRAVCELAASPITRPEGLVGELLEVFFDYITSVESAAIEKEKDNEKDEIKKKESEKDEVEKEVSEYSKEDKKKIKQALRKENNKLKKKNEIDLDSEEEQENNEEENTLIEDPLLKSEEPLSKLDDLLQELENQINLKRSRRDYLSAAIKGRSKTDCQEHYSTCPISLFKLASQEDY